MSTRRVNLIRLTAALLLILCSGCGKKAFPAGRLAQPAGDISYVTPDGWFRTKLAGIDYIIVSTSADYGIKPNIFIEGILPSTQLSTAVLQTIKGIQSTLLAYEVEKQNDFITQSGLFGIKVQGRHRNKQNLPLATFRYFIQDSDRIILITCTCADVVKSKYEPIFDSAIASLQSEREEN